MILYRKEVERAIQLTAPPDGDVDAVASALYDLASECDRLRTTVAENGAYLARQYEQLTAKARRGEALHASTPLGNSATHDFVRNVAALHVAERHFMQFFRARFGTASAKALQAEIERHITEALNAGTVSQ